MIEKRRLHTFLSSRASGNTGGFMGFPRCSKRFLVVGLVWFHIIVIVLAWSILVRPMIAFYRKQSTKILLVSHELSPTGAVRSLLDIGIGLRREGYFVDFITLDNGFISQEMHDKNRDITIVGNNDVYNELLSYTAVIANSIVTDSWIEIQGKVFGKAFFDRLLWYIRELPVGDIPRKLYTAKATEAREKIFTQAKAVIFVSHASRDVYLQELGTKSRKNFKVIYNPVDNDYLENLLCANAEHKHDINLAMRNWLSISEDDSIVLVVGKFSKSKGPYDLIESFDEWIPTSWRYTKTIHLIFVGEIESEWFARLKFLLYKYQIRKSGMTIRIHAIGPVFTVQETQRFYAAADVFILNSYCEAFGRVILEAFATGVPVVARNCGGPSEIVKNMTRGLLYKSDFERMSLINLAISHKGLSEEMTMASCKYVQNFHDPKQHIRSLERLIA